MTMKMCPQMMKTVMMNYKNVSVLSNFNVTVYLKLSIVGLRALRYTLRVVYVFICTVI